MRRTINAMSLGHASAPATVLIVLALGLGAYTARAEEESKSYDLVVIGGAPGGVACAVRAAREGASVLLVNRHDHLGGIVTSGLGVWDTLWEGKRSPVYDELRAALFDYYRTTYGADSPQARDALPGKSGHSNGRYEPHVAEKIINALVEREKNITVLRREARTEFCEPHAGIVFMHPTSAAPSAEAAYVTALHDALKLRRFPGWQEVMPESTGAADEAVQACNYRTMLTTDPGNRAPIPKPANYAPYFLKSLEIFSGIDSVPNGKFGWNRPQLVGRQTAYVEADWTVRQRIMDDHWETTLGLLYFLQNDPSVPETVRRAWLGFGLAKDDFADNGHRPYEMYIREARRIVGRAIFTEHDATLAAGLPRAPVHADSVAMTEWYIDTHSCTTARVPGGLGLDEGKMMLAEETFPGEIPYRCLLPQGVDNLLVPVCLSATHVAWGTVRLEPVFVQTGEAAGLAAALAVKHQTTPAQLDADELVRALCERGSMVAFFNDVDVSAHEPWIAAVEYFGAKGFFHDYNARMAEPLRSATGAVWADGLAKLLQGKLDPTALVHAVFNAEQSGGKEMTEAEFAALLPASPKTQPIKPGEVISRGAAAALMFSLLP